MGTTTYYNYYSTTNTCMLLVTLENLYVRRKQEREPTASEGMDFLSSCSSSRSHSSTSRTIASERSMERAFSIRDTCIPIMYGIGALQTTRNDQVVHDLLLFFPWSILCAHPSFFSVYDIINKAAFRRTYLIV